jgi:hypothetical protein
MSRPSKEASVVVIDVGKNMKVACGAGPTRLDAALESLEAYVWLRRERTRS